ncbi:hypothetical protein [Flavobacterium rivuli]|uniref:hypothetical protein n=1 Tax=Flavobacterium rivuli TaxID=498301 RepID=UPI0012E01015|nr:hypothetical protein [Flavobacterium rivuli]
MSLTKDTSSDICRAETVKGKLVAKYTLIIFAWGVLIYNILQTLPISLFELFIVAICILECRSSIGEPAGKEHTHTINYGSN